MHSESIRNRIINQPVIETVSREWIRAWHRKVDWNAAGIFARDVCVRSTLTS